MKASKEQAPTVLQTALLPPVGQLKSELLLFTSGSKTTRQRVAESFQYTEAIKMAEGRNYYATSEELMHNQVLSELFLDAVDYFGNSSLFVMEGRGSPSWHTKTSQPYLLAAAEARKNILGGIGAYVQLSQGQTEAQQYEKLRVVMLDARCAVIGSNSLDVAQTLDTDSHIRGLMAEYKACIALQENGWPQATYSCAKDDLDDGKKYDIIIPQVDSQPLGIQVKGRKSLERITVKKAISGLVLVHVPMHETHSKIRLSETHAQHLARKIASFLLPSSLQTEVEVVKLAA